MAGDRHEMHTGMALTVPGKDDVLQQAWEAWLEDSELNAIADARQDGSVIRVGADEL